MSYDIDINKQIICYSLNKRGHKTAEVNQSGSREGDLKGVVDAAISLSPNRCLHHYNNDGNQSRKQEVMSKTISKIHTHTHATGRSMHCPTHFHFRKYRCSGWRWFEIHFRVTHARTQYSFPVSSLQS